MKLFKRFLPVFLLIMLESILFATNYELNTYLVGWDNVMPEFNLSLNFQRALTSLWQDYRGLGLVDGLAHSANLLHTLYIALLSLFLPDSLLRYTYIHLTHLLGGIAFFYLLKYLLSHRGETPSNQLHIRGFTPSKAAFLGGLFYMFNLGIIQIYFAPLEVFATHFVALPFLALTTTKALKEPSKKHFFLLFLASLLVSPQGFVPTVFIAFLILFFFLLLFHILKTGQGKVALLTALTVFLANAFWLMPYLVSAVKTPQIIQNTRINQFGSEEIFYRNKAHGTLTSTFGLNGFMMSTIEYDQEKNSDLFFMQAWRDYEQTVWYKVLSVGLLGVIFWGVIQIFRKKQSQFYPYLATSGVAFLFLANNTVPLEQLNSLFRLAFPILGEAFRFPFTKFVTLFAFGLSVCLAVGFNEILPRLKKYANPGVVVTSGLILLLALPVFQGNFTSPLLRLNIPQDYFELMSYFQKGDPDQRIAVLPAHTFWNWHYRTWGHRGSGFLWYGIPQPVLERAFDPWSLSNEQYYNELEQAINSQDQNLLESVIQKYDLSYIFVDQYVINTLSSQPINYDSMVHFLDSSPSLQNKKAFGRLLVYPTTAHPHFVSTLPPSTPNTLQSFFTRTDHQEAIYGSYVTDPSKTKGTIYPLSSLFSEKLQSDLTYSIEERSQELLIKPNLQHFSLSPGQEMVVPNLFASEFLVPVNIKTLSDGLSITPLYPDIIINNKRLTVPAQPLFVPLKIVRNPTVLTLIDTKQTVTLSPVGTPTYLLGRYPNTLEVSDGRNKESLIFDTSTVPKEPITLPVQDREISSFAFSVKTFSNPFSVTDILATRDYTLQENKEHLQPFAGPTSEATAIRLGDTVNLIARSGNEELVFYKDNLLHQASYILLTKVNYQKGLPLNFYLDNPYEHRADLETVMAKKDTTNIQVIPPTQAVFSGYGFHFTVKSVGTEEAQSTIEDLKLYPFPQRFIEQTAFTAQNAVPIKPAYTKTAAHYTRENPALFVASAKADSYLLLSQAYDTGWLAFSFKKPPKTFQQWLPFLGGQKLQNHILVNNWSNGWYIPKDSGTQIVMLYWPIYLQYLGQFMTMLALIVIIISAFQRGFTRHRT